MAKIIDLFTKKVIVDLPKEEPNESEDYYIVNNSGNCFLLDKPKKTGTD